MYNTIKVELRDHSQVSRIYTKTKTAAEAKALAKRWAKKLESFYGCYDLEPFAIWYGYTDYDGSVKFMDGEVLVND